MNLFDSLFKASHVNNTKLNTDKVYTFKFYWEVRIYELGSCNYDLRCVQVTLARVG